MKSAGLRTAAAANCVLWLLLAQTAMPASARAPIPPIKLYLPIAFGNYPLTAISLRVVTGANGTNDKPIFKLYNRYGELEVQFTMDKAGALQPGQTDEFTFTSAHDFCDFTGYTIHKPAGPGGDDPWDLRVVHIYLDDMLVFADGAVSDFGPITSTSHPPNGGWRETDVYRARCGG